MIVRTSCKMQHHPKSCPREKDPAGPEMGWRVLGSWVPVLQKEEEGNTNLDWCLIHMIFPRYSQNTIPFLLYFFIYLMFI